MDYYFYNTDGRLVSGEPQPRFRILIERGFAALGGDRQKFGEQFRQLKQNDNLLMYQNSIGVVAVGRVRERWDGKSHKNPWYYSAGEMEYLGSQEYRINVEWFLDLSGKPISLENLRKRLGSPRFRPRGAVKRIVKGRPEIIPMIEDLRPTPLSTRLAIDLSGPAGERIETTTYRILRDTAMALSVKDMHQYECQVCGHTIVLPDGKRYAEAHHIQPLGRPHDGPDIIGNIICVCPNHHAELDYGVTPITLSGFRSANGHVVHQKFVDYHNRIVYNSKGD